MALFSVESLPMLVSIAWLVSFHLITPLLNEVPDHRSNDVSTEADYSTILADDSAVLSPTGLSCDFLVSGIIPSIDERSLSSGCTNILKAPAADAARASATNNSPSTLSTGLALDWVMVGAGILLLAFAAVGCTCFRFKEYAFGAKGNTGTGGEIPYSIAYKRSNGIHDFGSDRLSATVDDIEPFFEGDNTMPVLLKALWTQSMIEDSSEDKDGNGNRDSKHDQSSLHVTFDNNVRYSRYDDDHADFQGDMTVSELKRIQRLSMAGESPFGLDDAVLDSILEAKEVHKEPVTDHVIANTPGAPDDDTAAAASEQPGDNAKLPESQSRRDDEELDRRDEEMLSKGSDDAAEQPGGNVELTVLQNQQGDGVVVHEQIPSENSDVAAEQPGDNAEQTVLQGQQDEEESDHRDEQLSSRSSDDEMEQQGDNLGLTDPYGQTDNRLSDHEKSSSDSSDDDTEQPGDNTELPVLQRDPYDGESENETE